MSCVICNGCFDLLHLGHLYLLEYAKSIAMDLDVPLVAAINTDESIRRLKGTGRPFYSLDARMRLLGALRCVDKVVSFDEDTPYDLFLRLKPCGIVKGSDYVAKDVVGADVCPVFICPRIPGFSTTEASSLYSYEVNNGKI